MLVSGVFGVDIIGISQTANLGEAFSLLIPIDGQLDPHRTFGGGLFCVGMDYVLMAPFVAVMAGAELGGSFARCNVKYAGDYVVAQLADIAAMSSQGVASYNGPRPGGNDSLFAKFGAFGGSSDSSVPVATFFAVTGALAVLIWCAGCVYRATPDPLRYHLADGSDDEDTGFMTSAEDALFRRVSKLLPSSLLSNSGISFEVQDGIQLRYYAIPEPGSTEPPEDTNDGDAKAAVHLEATAVNDLEAPSGVSPPIPESNPRGIGRGASFVIARQIEKVARISNILRHLQSSFREPQQISGSFTFWPSRGSGSRQRRGH